MRKPGSLQNTEFPWVTQSLNKAGKDIQRDATLFVTHLQACSSRYMFYQSKAKGLCLLFLLCSLWTQSF